MLDVFTIREAKLQRVDYSMGSETIGCVPTVKDDVAPSHWKDAPEFVSSTLARECSNVRENKTSQKKGVTTALPHETLHMDRYYSGTTA